MRTAIAFTIIALALAAPMPAWAGLTIPFRGMVDLHEEHLTMQFGEGEVNAVSFDLRRSAEDAAVFSVDLRHVRLPFCDLLTEVRGDVHLAGGGVDSREVFGELRSYYTLVNQKPVRDLYLKFSVRERKLIINRFWAGALSGSGQVELFGEHRSNITLDLVSADLEHILGFFHSGRMVDIPSVSGVLAGSLSLTGPLLAPDIKGRLAAYNGCFSALCYESILLQLGGVFPRIRLDNSEVHTEGFSFDIIGSVDLSDSEGLPAQVERLKKVAIVNMDGNRREWILKQQRSDGNSNSVVEMKYLILKDDRGDSEGVLGFEQKIGF